MKSKKILIIAFLIVSMLMNSASTVLATTVEVAHDLIEAEKAEELEESEIENVVEAEKNTETDTTAEEITEPEVTSEAEETAKPEATSGTEETAEPEATSEVEENAEEAKKDESESLVFEKSVETEENVSKSTDSKDDSEDVKTNVSTEEKNVEIKNEAKTSKDLQSQFIWESGRLSQRYVSSDGSKYDVIVTYGKNAAIPSNSTLKVIELEKGSNEYDNTHKTAIADIEKRNEEIDFNEFNMVALDISIIDENGKEVEPEAPVSVEIKIKSLPGVENLSEVADSVEIQHHKETKDGIIVEHFDCSDGMKNDKYIDKKFNVDGFSVFTIGWRHSYGWNSWSNNVNVHYVYENENGNGYTEFSAEQTPNFANDDNYYYKFLIYDFEGYEYSSTHLNSATGTTIKPLLAKDGNTVYYLSSGNSFENLDNSTVYVVYKKEPAATQGGTAKPKNNGSDVDLPEPEVKKESVVNGDGTNTLSLSVKGVQEKLEVEKLADVIVVFDVSGSMNDDMDGNSTNQNNRKRLKIAKDAVNEMASTLLGKNVEGKEELIRMSLISFSTTAEVKQGFTTDYNTFKNAVDSLSADGGTNWEEALKLANQMSVDSDRTTFVIFVSDGDPTFRVSRMNAKDSQLNDSQLDFQLSNGNVLIGSYANNSVFGEANDDSQNRNYNAALAQAKSIKTNKKRFYTIGISNDVRKMATLNTDAGGDGNYTATSSSELENAFNDIIKQIEGTVGWGASINDGITTLTNLTAKVPVVGIDTGSFKYTMIKKGSTTEEDWDPVAAGAKNAEYNSSTGEVEWNLNDGFQLEDGVTYKVSFVVWPSQEAIDWLTKLKNNEVTYDNLPDYVKNQIEVDPNNSENYILKTNTDDAHYSYQLNTKIGDTVTPVGDIITKQFEPVDPLNLDTMTLKVIKKFTHTLTNGSDKPEKVVLKLQYREVGTEEWKDLNVPNTNPLSNEIVLNDGNGWTSEFYISPGFRTSEGITYNKGYEYRIIEPDIDYHYDLNGEIIKPMLIDMKDHLYEGDNNNDGALTAENIVKGGINIRKKLLDQEEKEITNDDTEFVIRGYIKDSEGNPYTFNQEWDDREDKSSTTQGGADWEKHQNDTGAYHKYTPVLDANGNYTYDSKNNIVYNRTIYKGHFDSTANIEIHLKPGEYVRFINVPQGSLYEFYEDTTNLSSKYKLQNIAGINNTVNDKGEVTQEGVAQPVVSTDKKVSGTIYGNVEHNVNITNQKISIDVTFKGTKTIEGRTMKPTDIFEFEVSDGTNTWNVKNDENGNINYPTFTYTAEGQYQYTIKEISQNGNGITKDGRTYNITVNVNKNSEGKLEATFEGADVENLNFVNQYNASGIVTFKGTKTLDGRELKADEFIFEIKDEKGNTFEAKNDKDGNIIYPSIPYTLADVGTHTYTIREKTESGNGITADDTQYTVTVEVKDNGNGVLNIKYNGDNHETLNFTNTYEAKGEVTFKGTKTLEGRDLTDSDIFTFTIYEKVEQEDGTVENKVIGTATNNANKIINYPTIKYIHNSEKSDVGTHTYLVKETSQDGKGITVDNSEYTVTVTVSDNGDGNLNVVKSDNYQSLNFVNKYEAKDSITFEGTKTIDGRTLTKNDIFTFTVVEKVEKDGVVTEKTIDTVTNDSTGKINYPTINYTQADSGLHTYVIRETSTNGNGITVDGTEYTVTVNVIDNKDGTLTVSPSNNAMKLNFENTYSAKGSVTFKGTKTLNGRDMTDDDVFTFEVKDEKGTTWKATSDSTGKINYPTINYELKDAGTHNYTVKETSSNGNGITVDKTTYTITVEVTDNGDGTLKVEPSKNYNQVNFINEYEATASITFVGTKTLDGRDLKAEEFVFEIEDEKGNTFEAKNDKDGNIIYPEIKYVKNSQNSDLGLHTYTIKESTTDGNGIKADTRSYTVKVNVTDNGDGTLKFEKDSTSDDFENLNFENTYTAKGELLLTGTKTLTGRDMTEDDVFTFAVVESIDGKDQIVTTGKNSGNTINFEKIEYTLDDVGTHTYTISEISKNGNGITIDDTTYTVIVEVTDNGDGTLKVEPDENAKNINFVNKYEAKGNVELAATKVLEGKNLEADQFKFELKDSENKALKIATNDSEGNIKFEAIEYTEKDIGKQYTYTIEEVDDGIDGYVYDDLKINVEVKIEDNGDGTLKVTPNYSSDTEFNNEYQTVEVSVEKVWDDNDNQDGIRPDSINVTLYANGENPQTVELNEENNWKYTWKELVKHSDKINIEYTVEEDEVEGYEVSAITKVDEVTGNVTVIITNTHKAEKADVKVVKVWEDADNHDDYRPDSIKVQLYANGKAYGDVITLDDSNGWAYTWEGLVKNESGKEIKYSVEELEVPDKYSVEYLVDEDGTLKIVNTQIPGEGGYEEPPAEVVEPPVKTVEPEVIDNGNNPGTGTNIFDSFELYFALILGAIALVFVETKRLNKKQN